MNNCSNKCSNNMCNVYVYNSCKYCYKCGNRTINPRKNICGKPEMKRMTHLYCSNCSNCLNSYNDKYCGECGFINTFLLYKSIFSPRKRNIKKIDTTKCLREKILINI